MLKKILLVLIVISLIGCSSNNDSNYPTSGTPSPAQTQEEVLWPVTLETSILSDGSLAQIDYSSIQDGYVCAKLLQSVDGIKIQISKDDKKYNYDLASLDYVSFPINMEDGLYTLKILQQIEGDRYAICASQDVQVTLTDANSPYLYPNQIVDYNSSSLVYSKSFEIVKNDEDDLTRVAHLFQYVVNTLDYDDDKAKNVSDSFHLPDIEGSLESGKGICFDYAASLAALCRIQGIPAKVIVGWTDIEYHAWVEIYIKDKGWINPKIYFKKRKWNLVDPTFADSANSDYEGKYEEVYHY